MQNSGATRRENAETWLLSCYPVQPFRCPTLQRVAVLRAEEAEMPDFRSAKLGQIDRVDLLFGNSLTLLQQRGIQLVPQGLASKSEIDSSGGATAHV
jgi:hypothetical protein